MFVACCRLDIRESKKVTNWDQNGREREEEGEWGVREEEEEWAEGGGQDVSNIISHSSSRYTGFFSIYCGN